MIALAVDAVPRKLMFSLIMPILSKIELIRPCVANIDLKINEYDTRDVAHGKNIHVLNNPLNLRSLLLRSCANKIAKINMIGTSTIK